MSRFTTRTLTVMALLTALEIVLCAGVVGALADVLGAVLFPIGAYFPGFTLTAFLMGLCYGLFLKGKQSFPRILGAVAVHQLVLSLLLNSLWISVLYGSPYRPLLLTRLPQCAILSAVQLALIPLIAQLLPRLRGRGA